MASVTVDELARDPLALLGRAEAGETIVVTRVDKPIAEIRPIVEAHDSSPPPFGLAKGDFVVPDDLNAPLPDDLLDAFEGR